MTKGYETKHGKIILGNLKKKTIEINKNGEIVSETTSETKQEQLQKAQEKRAERFGLKVRKV